MKKDNSTPNKKSLSTKEKIGIIKQLGRAGVWLLSFCSGEPLLSNDLEVLIKNAKKEGMLVNISTNGSLLEQKAEMLVNSGVDFIIVSVDSYNHKLHDEIRGFKGLFESINKGIEKIKHLRKNKRPYIEIRCLVNKINAFQLNEFVDYWKGRVDNIMFKPIYKNPAILFKIPNQLEFHMEDENNFRTYYNRFLNKHKKIDNLYHRGIPNFFFKEDILKKQYPCFAGTFFGEIDCEGNLYSCQEMSQSLDGHLGNLVKDDFSELWSSVKMNRLRSHLKSGSRCSCWVERFIFNIYLSNFLKPIDKMMNIFRRN